MSKFRELRLNTPKLTIKEGAREVIFKTVSCMCDNVGHLRLWTSDHEGWDEVIKMINSGTSVIESVISR
jgi:hypothetical protein